jgi:hypothetical protein
MRWLLDLSALVSHWFHMIVVSNSVSRFSWRTPATFSSVCFLWGFLSNVSKKLVIFPLLTEIGDGFSSFSNALQDKKRTFLLFCRFSM